MTNANGSLTQQILDRTVEQGSLQCCGLFVVRWESKTAGAEDAQAEVPLRIRRLLQTLALRFKSATGSVAGWMQTGSSLIFIISLDEDQSTAEEAEIVRERMGFHLRDLAVRTFSAARTHPPETGGCIRSGFAWFAGSVAATLMRSKHWEEIILNTLEKAWKQMFTSEATTIDLPGSDVPTASLDMEIVVQYAPIVSLLDGSLYGYEAMPFAAGNRVRLDLSTLYEEADRAGKLFDIDRSFREAAIRGFPSRDADVRLFLPVPAKIIYDPRLYPGSTLRRIEAAGLRSEHVVLMLIGGENPNEATVKAALSHYRQQGFRIALSDISANRSSLRRMVKLHPDYAQINVRWMNGDGKDSVEESLLKALTSLGRKEHIVLIASGLDREVMLPGLVSSGINYGQGEWVGTEQNQFIELASHVQSRIRTEVSLRYQGASGSLSELACAVEIFGRDTPVSEISKHFEVHREAQGLVIADNGRAIGLLMREKLHRMLSGQFGLPLYWNRPVGEIMDTHPMIVEESTPVDQVSQMAMAREPDKLYDAVIVTRKGLVTGTVSIQAMLEWVTQSRITEAQWANPLTGLPGNEPIRRELIRRLADNRLFSIWYADLDYFKWYNDKFGFHRGDEVIRYTGEVLLNVVRAHISEDSFIGHIGGDDFIVISTYPDPIALAQQVLNRFEEGLAAYTDKQAGPVLDRSGMPVDAPGLSMSLCLLICDADAGWTPERVSEQAAALKKKAKLLRGNSLVWEIVSRGEEHFPSRMDLTVS